MALYIIIPGAIYEILNQYCLFLQIFFYSFGLDSKSYLCLNLNITKYVALPKVVNDLKFRTNSFQRISKLKLGENVCKQKCHCTFEGLSFFVDNLLSTK